MTLTLLNAIQTKFATTGALTTAFPAFGNYAVAYFAGEAAEGCPLPFAVSTVIAAPRETAYGEVGRATVSVQFAVYGDGHDATGANLKTLTDAFDGAVLTLATGHLANTVRTSEPLPTKQPDADQSGGNVWQWVVTYDFTVTTR